MIYLLLIVTLRMTSLSAADSCANTETYLRVLRNLLRNDPSQGLVATKIAAIRPTQGRHGQYEVELKKKELAALLKDPAKLDEYLRNNPVPTVIGPDGIRYATDKHHLMRALHELGIDTCYQRVVADLSSLDQASFVSELQARGWIYLHDDTGKLTQTIGDLPQSVAGLRDDPYRSLAYLVKKAGGFKKSKEPFSEFKWANFFRARIMIGPGEQGLQDAVAEAMRLAQSDEARNLGLPGLAP